MPLRADFLEGNRVPGGDSEDVYINETDGLASRVILGGPCILVEGDGVIKSIVEDIKVTKPTPSLIEMGIVVLRAKDMGTTLHHFRIP